MSGDHLSSQLSRRLQYTCVSGILTLREWPSLCDGTNKEQITVSPLYLVYKRTTAEVTLVSRRGELGNAWQHEKAELSGAHPSLPEQRFMSSVCDI